MTKMNQLTSLAFFVLIMPYVAESANILAIFPHIGKSHYFMFQPFVYKLAERGHTVHVVTHFPDENPPPNVKFVNLLDENEPVFFNALPMQYVDQLRFARSFGSLIGLRQMGVDTCKKLGHPNIKKLLTENHKFDLLIVEFFNTDCFASLAHIFKVPMVGIFSSAVMPWHNDRFGNPDNPSYIGNHFLSHKSSMTFFERVVNTFITFFTKIVYRLFYDPPADAAVAKYLGEGIPPVRDLVKNASLFLINSHFSLFQPRPFVPGMIELGGFHVAPPTKKIPADILKVIEESKTGVIFFSLGSTVRGASMTKEKLQIFQNVFSKIPMTVLWKWEDDVMEGKPENVFIGKWFPQNELLAHPNVKLFFTHAGLMGTEEAVYHGVPMLLMPLFGDQPLNAASVEEKGAGLLIDYFSLSDEYLLNALQKVLSDKSYKENAKRLAKIFLDRPANIMDTAIYWTEYVLRYNGAPHLRSAAVDLAWHQEYLIDVAVFMMATLVAFFYLVKFLWKMICSRSSGSNRKQKKQKRN